MLRAVLAELGTPGPLKGFGKLFGISRVLEIQWQAPTSLSGPHTGARRGREDWGGALGFRLLVG